MLTQGFVANRMEINANMWCVVVRREGEGEGEGEGVEQGYASFVCSTSSGERFQEGSYPPKPGGMDKMLLDSSIAEQLKSCLTI